MRWIVNSPKTQQQDWISARNENEAVNLSHGPCYLPIHLYCTVASLTFRKADMAELNQQNSNTCIFYQRNKAFCRSQWPRGLRRRSTAARLLRSWVRIPPGAWMSVCCECCVLSGRSLRRADHSSRGVLPTVACRV